LIERWSFAVIWVTLPFTMGPALSDALAPTATLFRTACSVGLWLVWAAILGAALIPRTVTLTAIRIVAPAALVAAAWAALSGSDVGAADVVALAVATVAAIVALAAGTAAAFVNGSAYGLEHRIPLRAPGPLLLGPIELAWVGAVAGAAAGPLLLADRAWIVGTIAVVVGWPVCWWASRSLHILSRRWLVFTPAGVVLHDQLAVLEAVLVTKRHLRSLGPALVGTDARDLTLGAPGLALEIRFTEPLAITPTPPRRRGRLDPVASEDVAGVLFTPTRPGRVMDEVAQRELPIR
jgi:hypothetical protein